MDSPRQPREQLSFAQLVREYLIPYNTLFALSAVVAFLFGLVSPLLVIGFGACLISLGLLIAAANAWRRDALFAWAHTGRDHAGKAFTRLVWPNADSRLRSSGIFWVIVGMGIAVTLYGSVFEKVRAERSGAPLQGASAAAGAGAARIVVFPFSTLASESGPKDALLADGITDDISGGLSRFAGLRVIGRTTSTAFQASKAGFAELRDTHGIRYVLNGSFRSSPEKFRLGLELVETAGGTTVWSERFDGPLARVVDIHDDVVRSVVGRVASQVMQSDLRQSRNADAAKLSAYELTLQGRQLWRRPTRETLPQAQALLNKAIAADPAYTPAYVYLSYTYLTSYNNSWAEGFSRAETLQAMLGHATKALELEPRNGTAHAARAIAQTYLGRHDDALAAAREAFKLNGSDPDTLARVGQVLSFSGEHGEAIKVLGMALDLDPLGPAQLQNFLSRAHFFSKDYDGAVDQAKICLERATIDPCRETLAAALAFANRRDEAAEAWNALAAKRPGLEPEAIVARLRPAFKRAGDLDHLVAGLSRARDAARAGAP